MKEFLVTVLATLILLVGCSQEVVKVPPELSTFIDVLKERGVDGAVMIREPFNEDMEYVVEYSIAKYTSTRVLSFFKFRDAGKAEANLEEALKNDKLSGQARNGTFVMAATFYPPDEEAVEELKALFLAHEFE